MCKEVPGCYLHGFRHINIFRLIQSFKNSVTLIATFNRNKKYSKRALFTLSQDGSYSNYEDDEKDKEADEIQEAEVAQRLLTLETQKKQNNKISRLVKT